MAVLVADDLFKFYHPGDTEIRALRGASLTVARGETVALIGPSGSGKSTLLACIAGLDDPDGGTVTVDGGQMTRRPEADRAALRARSIGFLAQSGNLFTHLSVAANIALQMDLRGMARDDAHIADLLRLAGIEHRAGAMPDTLSGGEAARAGLAVALVNDPALLIADEPTAEVDAATERHILDTLDERRGRGGATLIATHSDAVGLRASRIVRIEDGRIIAAKPAHRAEAEQSDNTRDRAVRRGAGRILIEARRVTCSYQIGDQMVRAVVGASCNIRAQDRIALIGPSGSGKSTLMNLLAGLEAPGTGSVGWPGLDLRHPLRPCQIGFVFQSPSLVPWLSVAENMRLPLEIAEGADLCRMDPAEALHRLALSDLADKLPEQLSGGQMQRVALARTLVTHPDVIFADEPTGQLDHATARSVIDSLLAELAGSDTALVIATHDMSLARRMGTYWNMEAGTLTIDTSFTAVA